MLPLGSDRRNAAFSCCTTWLLVVISATLPAPLLDITIEAIRGFRAAGTRPDLIILA